MKHRELITRIMSTDVVTANTSMKFSQVKKLMMDCVIHHIPVVSGKKLIGILSVTDVLKASYSALFSGQAAGVDYGLDSSINIEDLMTKNIVTLKNTDTVMHAAEILESSNFNSLPIIDENKDLVGIVTPKDLISYLLKQY